MPHFSPPKPPKPDSIRNREKINSSVQTLLEAMPSNCRELKTVGFMTDGCPVKVEIIIKPVNEEDKWKNIKK